MGEQVWRNKVSQGLLDKGCLQSPYYVRESSRQRTPPQECFADQTQHPYLAFRQLVPEDGTLYTLIAELHHQTLSELLDGGVAP